MSKENKVIRINCPEEKNKIRDVAEKYCTGEPHNDQAVLWIYIQKVSKACD